MGSNPWVPDAPDAPQAPSEQDPALEVAYRAWAPGAEVRAGSRLGRVDAPDGGLWVVGAHGGAGASTWAGLLGAGDAGRAWPAPPAGSVARALVVARTSAAGLAAARAAALEWLAGDCPGVELVGLILGADAPGRRTPRALAAALEETSGAFPTVVRVGWQEAWRLAADPGQARRSRSIRVRRVVRAISKITTDES